MYRVAVMLPTGPEMAVAVLTVAANATCAPVNPAYGVEELDRYFADLRPRALITQSGITCRRVVRRARAASVSSSCRPHPMQKLVSSRSRQTRGAAV